MSNPLSASLPPHHHPFHPIATI